jgi:hypothetical protein
VIQIIDNRGPELRVVWNKKAVEPFQHMSVYSLGVVMKPTPVAVLAANFSPMPRKAPPLGSEVVAGGVMEALVG